jgi:hypothetical protein
LEDSRVAASGRFGAQKGNILTRAFLKRMTRDAQIERAASLALLSAQREHLGIFWSESRAALNLAHVWFGAGKQA